MDECCICYQETKVITNCGHFICVECITELKTDKTEEEFLIRIKGKKCPVCRLYILYLK